MIVSHGTHYRRKKDGFWHGLEKLVNSDESLWVIMGDLNEVIYTSEKFKGKSLWVIDINNLYLKERFCKVNS